jgi:hypothetical protein
VSEGLSIRTDNSLSFWRDKDYELFESGKPNWNKNTERKELAAAFALVNHFIMWNGMGAGFGITHNLMGSVYLRNLLSRYSASGNTPGGRHDYVYLRDGMYLKLGLTYRFNEKASVYVNLEFEDMITSRSLDLNSQSANFFQSRVHNAVPDPVATTDNTFVVRIPIGISLVLR